MITFVFNRRTNTCQATTKCGLLRTKRQIVLQILFYSNGSFQAICFECSMHRWHPQKTKGANSSNANLRITSLMQGWIDCVKFHLDSQLRLYDDLVSEIINTMSETFTTGEKKQFKECVTASCEKTNAKFGKYFDEECGLHPAPKFSYEAQFLNPKTALKFHVRPEFNAIPGFSEVPVSEFFGY